MFELGERERERERERDIVCVCLTFSLFLKNNNMLKVRFKNRTKVALPKYSNILDKSIF